MRATVGLGRGAVVGLVKTASLEGDADVAEHFAQGAATGRAPRQGVVLERLDDLQMFTA
jgi:hypothetical protein